MADMEVDKVSDKMADIAVKKINKNFTTSTEFQNFNQISQVQTNFTISTKFLLLTKLGTPKSQFGERVGHEGWFFDPMLTRLACLLSFASLLYDHNCGR